MNFNWGKRSYTECCIGEERTGIAWLLAGVWKLKGIRKKADQERRPLCLGEEMLNTQYWTVQKLEIGEKIFK
jgi:hypothetical protein